MIESINQITNRTDCTEAVILQRRPVWVIAVFVVLFVLLMVLLPQDLGAALRGGIAGGVSAGVMTMVTESFLLGRTGDDIVLTKASKWKPGQATAVLSQWPAPVSMEVSKGLINRKVGLASENYVMPRAFESRLEAIAGQPLS